MKTTITVVAIPESIVFFLEEYPIHSFDKFCFLMLTFDTDSQEGYHRTKFSSYLIINYKLKQADHVLILKFVILLVRWMNEILDKSIYRTIKFRCKYE